MIVGESWFCLYYTVTKVSLKNKPGMWAEKNNRAIKFLTARPNGIYNRTHVSQKK